LQRVSHENEFVPRLSSHGRYGDEHIKPKRAEPISKSNCNASVMGRFSSSPSERPLVARIMLLSVVGTKGRHTMPSDPRLAGQSRTRDLPEHSQHYARPCQALVPATGPQKKRPYSTRSKLRLSPMRPEQHCSSGTRSPPPTCDGGRRPAYAQERLSRASCRVVVQRRAPSVSSSKSEPLASA